MIESEWRAGEDLLAAWATNPLQAIHCWGEECRRVCVQEKRSEGNCRQGRRFCWFQSGKERFAPPLFFQCGCWDCAWLLSFRLGFSRLSTISKATKIHCLFVRKGTKMNTIGRACILVRRISPRVFFYNKGTMFAFRCFSTRWDAPSQLMIRKRLFSTGFKDEGDFYVRTLLFTFFL